MSDGIEGAFRAAMRRLAATVTIVTASGPDGPAGMTATSVTSLSMAPPSLLVCVNREASVHPALAVGGRFCVNVLAEPHAGLAQDFGGGVAPEDRFARGHWRARHGVLCLDGAAALVFCTVDLLLDYGTHTIVVGRVTGAETAPAARPLLWGEGGFLAVGGCDGE